MPRKTLYRGKFIHLIRHEGWEFVERRNCTGIVIVIARTKDGKIILVEQYRPPVGKNVIEFPAGLVSDSGRKESHIEAARREFLEETGYEAKKLVPVLKGPVNTGLSADLVIFYRAVGITKKSSGGGADEGEKIIVHEVPTPKVERFLAQMAKRGRLIDPKVYAGLYFLMRAKG